MGWGHKKPYSTDSSSVTFHWALLCQAKARDFSSDRWELCREEFTYALSKALSPCGSYLCINNIKGGGGRVVVANGGLIDLKRGQLHEQLTFLSQIVSSILFFYCYNSQILSILSYTHLEKKNGENRKNPVHAHLVLSG